jgi:hypothetical protein
VVLEEHRIVRAKMDLGYRNNFALHLTGAGAELKLGHIAQAGSFAPARLAYQIPDIQRRTARAASESGLLVHALAPLALDTFERLGYVSRIGHKRSTSFKNISTLPG